MHCTRRFVWAGLALVGLIMISFIPATAQETDGSAAPLRIATKEIEPFVFVDGEDVSGFSIDLWQEIAREAGLDYTFEIVETVQDQLDAVIEGEADAAIAAISVTQEREISVDFSYAFFASGLGILISNAADRRSPLLGLMGREFVLPLFGMVLLLLAVIVITGHIIWLLERRNNPDFPQDYVNGVGEGIWWSAVTVTTVGYGDRTPRSRLGRIFGLFWMFAGLFIIANFTASVTSQLTISQIQRTINGPQDLFGKQVATVATSTAENWLNDQRISNSAVEVVDEAYALLEAGDAQAVVFDYPVLLYFAVNSGAGRFEVVGAPFNRENYGIAFPPQSPLREDVNQALLRLGENGAYDRLYAKWFGIDPNR